MKKFFIPFIVLLVLLTLTKIDFRFKEIPPGLIVDDAEYYYHAQTIAIDFDLDYSNQMKGATNRNLNIENPDVVVPVHPVGTGVFASPFLFISNQLTNIKNLDSTVSLNYFIYSLSPIFYLFLSLVLLTEFFRITKVQYNMKFLLLLISGSGITYFSFERFSMSHAYEFFGTALIFYLIALSETIVKKSNRNILLFIIGITIFLIFSIRWSNYFIFLIPIIYNLMFSKKSSNTRFSIYLFFGLVLGCALYLIHTKILYGMYTLNPADLFLVVENRLAPNYERFFELDRLFENIVFIFNCLLKISFGEEFGIAYFSPILFAGLIMTINLLIKKRIALAIILTLAAAVPLLGVIVLQHTAFSYGYRYLFALIPMYIIVYFKFFQNNIFYKYYLLFMSFFGFLGVLFFETSYSSILYSDYVTNIFGQTTKYSNPEYLTGVIKSFFIIDSYLNIIFTSFLGVLIIKILSMFKNPVDFISTYREPNEDILNLINNTVNLSWGYIFTLILFFILLIYYLSKKDYSKKLIE